MARKITFKDGNTTLKMSQEMQDMANALVNNLLPETRKKIEDELDRIEAEAKSKWLVRKKGSKGSRDKIYSEVVLSHRFELLGVLGNTADYAWAIRVGKDPQDTGLPKKKRIAQALLVSPVRRKTNQFIKIFIKEIGTKIGG